MSWYKNYMDNIQVPNKLYYEQFTQEVINYEFDDSTLVRTILEEQPNGIYMPFEVKVDSVAEVTVNITKVIGDFISVLFRQCNHSNSRGQKYIYNEETYLCYDKTSELSRVAETKLIRCNNELNWIIDGIPYTEKVFLGYEISSTNDSISKDGIVSNRRMVIYVQKNEKTKDIKVNQRFMFNHNQCYRVEEIDDYNMDINTEWIKQTNLMKLYVVYSTLLERDNKELNICDYYGNTYSVKIDQDKSIVKTKGSSGKLSATVTKGDEIVQDKKVTWVSSSYDVSISEDGTYIINQNAKVSQAVIYCSLDEYGSYDYRIIQIFDFPIIGEDKISVYPIINSLTEGESIEFECRVQNNGNLVSKPIYCYTEGAKDHFEITETVNGYKLKNVKASKENLKLKFVAEDCEDFVMDISLNGLL